MALNMMAPRYFLLSAGLSVALAACGDDGVGGDETAGETTLHAADLDHQRAADDGPLRAGYDRLLGIGRPGGIGRLRGGIDEPRDRRRRQLERRYG